MDLLLTFWHSNPYFDLPKDLIGWLAFFVFGLLGAVVLWRLGRFHADRGPSVWVIFFWLLLLTPLAGSFAGVRLPVGNALTPPHQPVPLQGTVMMLFSALPWLLAAGLLGPLPASVLALISGGLIGLFETHSGFTAITFGLLAMLVGVIARQRYRTPFYHWLRHPALTALAGSLLYPLVYLAVMPFSVIGTAAERMDYVFSHLGWESVAFSGSLLIAGGIAQFIALAWPQWWYGKDALEPSPTERSLEARLMVMLASVGVFLIVSITIGDWIVAGRASRTMLQERLRNTATVVADSIPFILETGQNLISQMANDPALYAGQDEEVLTSVLRDDLRTVPYFTQLALTDLDGTVLAHYPNHNSLEFSLELEEQVGVTLARQGAYFQMYSLPPAAGGNAARLSFVRAVRDGSGSGTIRAVLIGRTSLSENPFTHPLLANLADLNEIDGTGVILDDQGIVLYHPIAALVGLPYPAGPPESDAGFSEVVGVDGARQWVYTQPVSTRSWTVLTIVPARQAQELAMRIVMPLLALLLLVAVLIYFVLRFSLRVVTGSLQTLAVEASRIAGGHLDHALVLSGTDEVGRLGQSFERMRVSLKARLDELNQLLSVSQGVASSLEMESAVTPILEGALASGASAARIVLARAALSEYQEDAPTQFSLGPSAERYAAFDAQLLQMTEQQARITLTNPARSGLQPVGGQPLPEALMAVSLRHENVHYGTLWLAFDEPHRFSDEEIRYISTVAGQAALAAANARLYHTAQLGRQRLAAILASTPDPVLVTDHRDRLLLANPAARTLLAIEGDLKIGQPIAGQIEPPELLGLLLSSEDAVESVEVTFSNRRVYFANASPVLSEGKLMGRVCVLSDITYFKELDALKSEFVSTVSHDLRSPLTLMRGYATMLQMVGELNAQQESYIGKMVIGVESMSRLVNNLLDLGRIEAGVGLQLEMVPILDVTRQVVEALKIQASQKQIELVLDLPQQTMPLIEADQALLQQSIHNLIENAIKYTEAGGKVQISVVVRRENEDVLMTVRDNGIGIAPVDMPRLFERFYRAAGRKARQQRGSGLGLTIVKSIAERHGGTVTVESQLGQGSVFELIIPLRQPKEAQN